MLCHAIAKLIWTVRKWRAGDSSGVIVVDVLLLLLLLLCRGHFYEVAQGHAPAGRST
jgi:hypothetical protein